MAAHPGAVAAAVALSLVTVATVRTVTGYRRWRSGWLSTLAANRLLQAESEPGLGAGGPHPPTLSAAGSVQLDGWMRHAELYFLYGAWPDIQQWHRPSVLSAVCIVVVSAVILFVTTWAWQFLGVSPPASGVLFGSLAGLMALVAGLVIFAAESVRDAADPDMKQVLLRESRLWAVVVVAVLSPIVWCVARRWRRDRYSCRRPNPI